MWWGFYLNPPLNALVLSVAAYSGACE